MPHLACKYCDAASKSLGWSLHAKGMGPSACHGAPGPPVTLTSLWFTCLFEKDFVNPGDAPFGLEVLRRRPQNPYRANKPRAVHLPRCPGAIAVFVLTNFKIFDVGIVRCFVVNMAPKLMYKIRK